MTKNIKRFIYLDYDLLYSCYSQIANGLPLKSTESTNKAKTESNTNSGNISGDAAIDMTFLGKGIKFGLSPDLSGSSSFSQNDVLQKSVEKQVHDNMFNDLEHRLNKLDIINKKNSTNVGIGSFIRLSGNIEIIDMEYYRNLCSKENTLIRYMQKYEKSKSDGSNKIEKKQADKNSDKKYDSIRETLRALCDVIPYGKIAMIGDSIVVLEDKYLRDNPDTLAFKYGGEIQVLGYVTNYLSKDSSPHSNSGALSVMTHAINSAMLTMMDKDNIQMIHAIGMYY